MTTSTPSSRRPHFTNLRRNFTTIFSSNLTFLELPGRSSVKIGVDIIFSIPCPFLSVNCSATSFFGNSHIGTTAGCARLTILKHELVRHGEEQIRHHAGVCRALFLCHVPSFDTRRVYGTQVRSGVGRVNVHTLCEEPAQNGLPVAYIQQHVFRVSIKRVIIGIKFDQRSIEVPEAPFKGQESEVKLVVSQACIVNWG